MSPIQTALKKNQKITKKTQSHKMLEKVETKPEMYASGTST